MSKFSLPGFDPQATTSGTFTNPISNGFGIMLVRNESPVNLILTFNDDQVRISAWTVDRVDFDEITRSVKWSQEALLSNANSAPISQVFVDVFTPNEKVSRSYPIPLTRTANVGNTVSTSSSNSLINDGAVVNTQIIETTPAGQSSSAFVLDNMGNLTLRTLDNNVWSVVLQIGQSATQAATKVFHGNADTANSATNLAGIINADTAGSAGTAQHVRIKTNSTGTNTYDLYLKTYNLGVANDWLLMDHLGTVYASSVPATGITAGALPAGVTLATSQLTGTIDPAAQIASGTLAAGVTVPAANISGTVANAAAVPATGITAGALPAGVTIPGGQVSSIVGQASTLAGILNVDSTGSAGTAQHVRIKTNSTGTNTYDLYLKTYNLGVANDWLLMDHLGTVYASSVPATGITAGALPAGVTLAATQVTAGNLNIGTGTISTDNGTHTTDGSGNETINSLKTTGTHAVAGGNYGIETSGAVYFEAGNIKSTGSGVLNATSFKPLNGNGFLSKLGYFSGTGSGTVSHGAGATPTWIGITDSQAGSSMTVGVASYTSTQCTVTAGAAHTWLGVAL